VVGQARVVDRSKLRVRVACRGTASVRCSGRLTLLTLTGTGRRRRKVGLGGRNIRLRGGRSHRITMGVDARGRKLLQTQRTLHVRMAITQGKRSVLNRRFTLHQPASHHRHK
jgi:hypothetical protein